MTKINVSMETLTDALEQGYYEEAVAFVHTNLKTLTNMELYAVCELFIHFGLLDDVRNMIEHSETNNGDLQLLLAEIYIEQGLEDEALEVVNMINETDEAYIQALLLAADLYQMQGLEEVSEYKLSQAKNIMPNEPLIDFALAELYFHQADYVRSVPLYKHLSNNDTDIAGVNLFQRLALALSHIGEFEGALDYFVKAKKLDVHSLFEYGFTAYRAEQYTLAIQKFTHVIKEDEDFEAAYFYSAKAFEQENNLEEALEYLKRGLALQGNGKEMYFYAGQLAYKVGRLNEAAGFLKETLAIDPGYMDALISYTNVLLQKSDYEEVISLITEAEVNEDTDPFLDWAMATAYRETERFSDALNRYQAAYTSFKENSEFLEEYARFLLEDGNREDAIVVYKKIHSLDPTNFEVEQLLLELEQ
ncbi:tetratricopeptide repeat protein [Bacillus sp. HMF5848]|uniref:tetratricopeptide repeat protein n=1 Tax=Bacillus sp. HMF5848 TaxID=2495421 RepID=UPI000F77BB93|nr:tetratricopeptide repeat protein [Bacillus sp. HMF5848]RSK27420.1 tetratricopeptide repeat protein [Bacillus sp. HMF5848]